MNEKNKQEYPIVIAPTTGNCPSQCKQIHFLRTSAQNTLQNSKIYFRS